MSCLLAVALSMAVAVPAPADEVGCAGDCDVDGRTAINELVLVVRIALGLAAFEDCPGGDRDADGAIGIGDIIEAVRHLLEGCSPAPTETIRPSETGTPVPSSTETPTPTESAAIALVDRSTEAGVAARGTACLVFRDLDQDRRPDLLFASVDERGDYSGSLGLFHNRGDGTFAAGAVPLPLRSVYACTVGDVSGDGLIDVIAAGADDSGALRIRYLVGDGDGQFLDRSGEIPDISKDLESAQSVAVFDYDADGRLDIAVGEFGGPPFIDYCETTVYGSACYLQSRTIPPHRPVLLRNVDGIRFVAAPFKFPDVVRANAFNFFDWDEDGYVDVFLSGDYGVNYFYRNLEGNGFTDMLPAWGLDQYNHAMGALFADFDDDGDWDIYVAELSDGFVYTHQADGSLRLGEIPTLAAPTRTDNVWSPVAADFDNDGNLDVYAPSGSYAANLDELYAMSENLELPPSIAQSDSLIRNLGQGVFEGVRVANGSDLIALYPKQAAAADYDGDGRVDVAVLEKPRGYALRLLRNESPVADNHWIGFRLIGKSGGRDQIGATITLFSGEAEIGRRAVNYGGIGISSEVVHFGLGGRSQVDAASIRWADGVTTQTGPLAIDRINVVEQP